MKSRSIRTAYLAWWGALTRGGETIGDLHALQRVARLVAPHCRDVVILSQVDYIGLGELGEVRSDWTSVSPKSGDVLIFVCGPIIRGSQPLQALLSLFRRCTKIGFGVSILPELSEDSWQPFDKIIPRDGFPGALGDLAFGSRAFQYDPAGPLGICLRGAQREYGVEKCMHTQAAALAKLAIESTNRPHCLLDTRLNGDPGAADRILASFAACSVVVSTRLHGCMLALSLGIPFIAIDQIAGGAKVLSEASRLNWWAAWVADDPRAERFLADWPSATDRLLKAVIGARHDVDRGLFLAERAIVETILN